LAKDGFVYVEYERPSAMSAARVGATIALPARRPPFIVVHHEVETIIVGRWPGKLWRVQIMDAFTPEEEEATGGKLLPYARARYTRAVAVNVLEELSPARLFGVNGEAVCDVIAGAAKVDQAIAEG
jgi:hypothetical protein